MRAILVFLLLIATCDGQDLPPDAEPSTDDHPITFSPEAIDKANEMISGAVGTVYHDCFGEQKAVEAKNAAFLHDNWTLNLTNSTGMFTA